MTRVCHLLMPVASQNWPLFIWMSKNAFLHGDLKEVYTRLPLGLHSSSHNTVYKLWHSVIHYIDWRKFWEHGLTNFDILLPWLVSHSQYDPSLFLFKTSHAITILPVYVDDIITWDDPKSKPHLTITAISHASFHMEDFGPLTYSVLKFTKSKVDYLSINKYAQDFTTHNSSRHTNGA